VPTFAEAGVRGLEVNAWSGIFAPAGTPSTVIAALHGAIARIFADTEVQRRLEAVGIIPVTTDPAGLAAWMSRDRDIFRPLLQRAGLLAG
jgi:tripartite-type tricarboxylate transporter receptor subunit TctC